MSWRKALVTGAVLLPVVVAGGLVVAWSLSNLPPGLGWVDVVTAYSSRRDQFSEADERLAASLVCQSVPHAAADLRDERGAVPAHRVGLGVA